MPKDLDLSELAAKYPDWWKAHKKFSGQPNQRPDPWCPICRALVEWEKKQK